MDVTFVEQLKAAGEMLGAGEGVPLTVGAEEKGLEEEEEFPERAGRGLLQKRGCRQDHCWVALRLGGGLCTVSEQQHRAGFCRGAFQAWIEIEMEGRWSNIEKAEPGGRVAAEGQSESGGKRAARISELASEQEWE